MKAAIAYIPVLHEGYRLFIERNAREGVLLLIGEELTEDFKPIKKEIRALDAKLVAETIRSWGICYNVVVLGGNNLELLTCEIAGVQCLVAADEDITRMVLENHPPSIPIEWDRVFLRWDRHRTVGVEEVRPDEIVSIEEFDRTAMGVALTEAGKSSDWWRHVGAVLVKNGEVVLTAHNRHVPSEHTPYSNGDPRNNFSRGQQFELSTVLHAEAGIVAEAARLGISLNGASLYTTAFPCANCAKLIAYSGISTCYYSTGYANLDGNQVLNSQGVNLVLVQM
jgi:dCMP deaminase